MSGTFKKAKFIRQKCYLEDLIIKRKFKGKINKKYNIKYHKIKGIKYFTKLKITCAGMPSSCYKYVTFENFKTGFSCPGKFRFKHVKGGVKLVPTEFTIKEEKLKKTIENF